MSPGSPRRGYGKTGRPRRAGTLAVVLLGFCLLAGAGPAAATFSIVAVDPATGEVGSAGATCVTNAIQISIVQPGIGAMHTQATTLWRNSVNATALLAAGTPPQQIIDWLVANDDAGTPTIRQYLVAELAGNGLSAAYTGVDCDPWKGHAAGPAFAVGGNTLLGSEIVADMEAAFLASPGNLASRLMAALQAANVPGADTRCAFAGKPAVSAFLRVARPGDAANSLHLDLRVNDTTTNQNPIDLLQALYDTWSASAVEVDVPTPAVRLTNHPNPFNPGTEIRVWLGVPAKVALAVFDVRGREVRRLVEAERPSGWSAVHWDGRDAEGRGSPAGVYFARVTTGSSAATCRMLLLK